MQDVSSKAYLKPLMCALKGTAMKAAGEAFEEYWSINECFKQCVLFVNWRIWNTLP